MTDLQSANHLTWQGQGSSHSPMESMPSLTHHSSDGGFDSDSNQPDVSNLSETAEPHRSKDGRLMYFEHQVQRASDYSGPLDRLPVEEVRVLFEEVLKYSDACSVFDFPLPPAGLPGFLHSGYDRDDPEAELLLLGLRYLEAMVFNERRAMHDPLSPIRSS